MISSVPKKPRPATRLHCFRGRQWAVATILIWLLSSCTDSATSTTTAADAADTTLAATQPAPARPAATPAPRPDSAQPASAGAGPGSLGAFIPRKLPNGLALTIPANGVENQLLDLLATVPADSGAAPNPPARLYFDRITFGAGLAGLRPESREQLQNLAAILSAYPAVGLRIGHHSTEAPTPPANKKLAQQRANATLTELTRLGVAANRLQAPPPAANVPESTTRTGTYFFLTHPRP